MDESNPTGCLYLDDLDVGQRFTSATHTIDEAQIKAFAVQFDPQPFHTDEKKPRNERASKAWQRAAGTPPRSQCVSMLRAVRRSPGIVGAGGALSWMAPTRPGDVLHVESEVVEITPSRSRPDGGTIVLLSRKMNQRGEVVQIFKARLVVPRRIAS